MMLSGCSMSFRTVSNDNGEMKLGKKEGEKEGGREGGMDGAHSRRTSEK